MQNKNDISEDFQPRFCTSAFDYGSMFLVVFMFSYV